MVKTIGLSVSVRDMDQVQEWAEGICTDLRILHEENRRLTEVRDAVYDWWCAHHPGDGVPHPDAANAADAALLDAIITYDDSKGVYEDYVPKGGWPKYAGPVVNEP